MNILVFVDCAVVAFLSSIYGGMPGALVGGIGFLVYIGIHLLFFSPPEE